MAPGVYRYGARCVHAHPRLVVRRWHGRRAVQSRASHAGRLGSLASARCGLFAGFEFFDERFEVRDSLARTFDGFVGLRTCDASRRPDERIERPNEATLGARSRGNRSANLA